MFLVHPGGPFWAKKDKGAWSIPKGEFDQDEQPLAAAKREFHEETGQPAPAGEYQDLGQVKNKSGKTIYGWAVESDFDLEQFKSNTFSIEWPPHSGTEQVFPEADKAAWFDMSKARIKLHAAQLPFLDQLAGATGTQGPQQTSLL